MKSPLTPYQLWLEKEQIPVLTGLSVEDVSVAPLEPWPRLSGKGAYVDLVAFEGVTGAYICEIPPGGALHPEKHIYEEIIYIVSGHGEAEIWQDGLPKRSVNWQPGTLLAPPLNCWHTLRNTNAEPARFLAATTAPLVMDQFHNEDFIFNNPFHFTDRFAGEKDYFTKEGERDFTGFIWIWETNFVPDARTAQVDPAESKVSAGHLTVIELSKNVFIAHVADWPSGRYQKGHYHSAGAALLIIRGRGYTLIWPKDLGTQPFATGHGDRVVRIDWKEGSLFSPPDGWFHQHFNTGESAARQLALRYGSRKHLLLRELARKGGERDGALIDMKKGGTMIEYQDEDPEIRRIYSEELKKFGLEMKMRK